VADEVPRSRRARAAAENALVRVVHHYGERPEFVVLGGLVPDWLCSGSAFTHAGTTDIDVQVDLEIAAGSVNTLRLERALRNAEFEPEGQHAWRWVAESPAPRVVVKFELLADLDDAENRAIVLFQGCQQLGAVNLRGTGFAARDMVRRELASLIGGVHHVAQVNFSGLAGYLLAKCGAARERRKPKDWYDLAFVLLHNDAGGPEAAAGRVLEHFAHELVGATRTALDDLQANFETPNAQGPQAYVEQMHFDHPEEDPRRLAADAVVAVGAFHRTLFAGGAA
jgi:hypothetical protein